jgi:hypothetical protein
MSHEKLLNKIDRNADRLIKTYKVIDKMGLAMIGHRFLPMCDINRTLPANLSKEELREWVVLDTFDMFSPAYDNPQKISTVKKWMEDCGVKLHKQVF